MYVWTPAEFQSYPLTPDNLFLRGALLSLNNNTCNNIIMGEPFSIPYWHIFSLLTPVFEIFKTAVLHVGHTNVSYNNFPKN